MTLTLVLEDALEQAGVSYSAVEPGSPLAVVDWPAPALVATPSCADQLAAALRTANQAEAAVIPVGAGTKLGLGNPPRSADLYVSTARLDRIVEYEPANLTAILEAGMLLADVQARLAEHGQFLPLGHLAGTVGGLVAANASGPLRLGYGSARDILIGARVATPDGKLARTGGRVVKNVSGYDLGKLYIGSLGTLGVLVELAVKLAPLPTASATHLSVHPTARAALEMARSILRSSLSPLAADLLSPTAAVAVELPARGWTLAVLVGGVPNAVRRQIDDLGRLTSATGASAEALDATAGEIFWRRVASLGDAPAPLRLKASVPIASTERAIEAIANIGSNPVVWARAGSGIVYARWSSVDLVDTLSVDALAVEIETARRQLAALGGSLVLESAPASLKARLDVWGDVGDALPMMRALKAEFDPRATLNPGRYVGGI